MVSYSDVACVVVKGQESLGPLSVYFRGALLPPLQGDKCLLMRSEKITKTVLLNS